MEGLPIAKYPQILVSRPNTEDDYSLEISRLTPEPEVEECCEDVQLREILERLGIDFDMGSKLKYISHDSQNDTCIHCKLLEKVELLQENVEKISEEIESTKEILKIKKMQNKDLRNVVERLEVSIGPNASAREMDIETDKKSCSCASSCLIF
ncbi:hypothetical protein SteCoe_23858 [Stentor coeruleus]|uniref:Uncharacterized protein n=1 Tax=Stentor coeruleus TaxID=5963 RepID=A0A1R2BIY0_9CILI|nr:hypothetical protein SteCoe_23858 [Stentor coeruleus]